MSGIKKVLTIGSAMQDVFIQYEHAPTISMHTGKHQREYIVFPEGKKIEIDNVTYHTGGGGTNAATSFSRADFTVTCFAKVGTDAAGEFILNSLAGRGVDTSAMLQTPTQQTGCSFILPNPSGNRTVLVHRGANLTLQENELPYDLLTQTPILYITSLSGPTANLLPIITKGARPTAELIAVNPGTSQLTANVPSLVTALPTIDLLIMNTHEAGLLMQSLAQNQKNKKHLEQIANCQNY